MCDRSCFRLDSSRAANSPVSSDGGISLVGSLFERGKNFAQRSDQLFTRDVAFTELDSELEGFIFRLEVEQEGPRPQRRLLVVAPLAPGLVPVKSSVKDALQHFVHLLLGGLPGNLQQERFGEDAMLETFAAELFGDTA